MEEMQRNKMKDGEKEEGGELKSGESWTSGLLSEDCWRMERETGGETFSMMKLWTSIVGLEWAKEWYEDKPER